MSTCPRRLRRLAACRTGYFAIVLRSLFGGWGGGRRPNGLVGRSDGACWIGAGAGWSCAWGAPPSIPRCKGEHSLQVPRHRHEAPLAAHVFEPSQRKLTESEHGFDDAEHRFRSLFAQGVERSAF